MRTLRSEVVAIPLPGRLGRLQAQVKHALTGRQPPPRDRLQQLQLHIVISRADVLDTQRPRWEGCTICTTEAIDCRG